MTSTYGIDIILFHELNIIHHIFFCNSTSVPCIKFMTVNTLENNPLTIYAHNSIFKFKSSETYLFRTDFNYISIFISNLNY